MTVGLNVATQAPAATAVAAPHWAKARTAYTPAFAAVMDSLAHREAHPKTPDGAASVGAMTPARQQTTRAVRSRQFRLTSQSRMAAPRP
jgi:hypothetical protein